MCFELVKGDGRAAASLGRWEWSGWVGFPALRAGRAGDGKSGERVEGGSGCPILAKQGWGKGGWWEMVLPPGKS